MGRKSILGIINIRRDSSHVKFFKSCGKERRPDSAGINRHKVGDERTLHERKRKITKIEKILNLWRMKTWPLCPKSGYDYPLDPSLVLKIRLCRPPLDIGDLFYELLALDESQNSHRALGRQCKEIMHGEGEGIRIFKKAVEYIRTSFWIPALYLPLSSIIPASASTLTWSPVLISSNTFFSGRSTAGIPVTITAPDNTGSLSTEVHAP